MLQMLCLQIFDGMQGFRTKYAQSRTISAKMNLSIIVLRYIKMAKKQVKRKLFCQ